MIFKTIEVYRQCTRAKQGSVTSCHCGNSSDSWSKRVSSVKVFNLDSDGMDGAKCFCAKI